jgi:hypothetical protein
MLLTTCGCIPIEEHVLGVLPNTYRISAMLAPINHPQVPEPTDIQAALARICASRPFVTAPRLTSFLRFVVQSTLAGQGARLKGYTIGVEALGRDENFNPQIDAIVRVEAIRLRAALARYYAGAGSHDPVVIEMPRGRYVAHFRWARRSGLRMVWWRARSALQRLLAA